MSKAIIVAVLALLLGPFGSARAELSQQPTQSQSDSQSGQLNSAASPGTHASKPCPASSDSSSGKQADCKTPATSKRPKHHPVSNSSPGEGPTKTIVRNGSTSEPTVAISPDLSSQQASQQLHSTDELLASADANLKQIANRQLGTAEEDTLKQIRVYMEQARTAAKNGEVQRAYNLANKANMLSVDLAASRP